MKNTLPPRRFNNRNTRIATSILGVCFVLGVLAEYGRGIEYGLFTMLIFGVLAAGMLFRKSKHQSGPDG